MRNKAELNKDFAHVAKEEINEEVDAVQMCAHAVRHTSLNYVDIEPVHTKSGSKYRFHFEPITREATEEVVDGLTGTEVVDDIKYLFMEAL